jgi:hypothetical protein
LQVTRAPNVVCLGESSVGKVALLVDPMYVSS